MPYEKIGNNPPVCIVEEVPFEIPESWAWVRLKNIGFMMGGYAFKSTGYRDSGVRVIRISDFDENGLLYKEYKYYGQDPALDRYIIHSGDILMCMTGGTVGKTCLISGVTDILYLNQRVAGIRRISAEIDVRYLYTCIACPYIKEVIRSSKTSTNDNISMDTISDFLIPVPPLKEQERIVDMIYSIQPYIDGYKLKENSLSVLNSSFPDLLKKSILQQAVMGKLVPQDETDESASVLLDRIRAEKQALIKTGKLKKDKHESVIFRRDNSHYEKRDGVEVCIDDEAPFEIPVSWAWTRLTVIFSVLNGDRGKNYPSKSTLSSSGIPFISALNLDGRTVVRDDKLLCMSQEQYDRLGNGKLIKDDIVVCIRGSLGKHGRYPFNKGAIASSLVILRPYINISILSDYIMLYLDSPLFFAEIKKYDNGTAQPNLAAKSLQMFFVPIPPLKEQERIVRAINNAFSKVSTL